MQELSPHSAAARVLELIALGADTFTAVRDRAGLAPATTSEALVTLEGLGLLERVTPIGEDARRTKRVRYQIRDPFLHLWLAIVLPHRESFELGRGEGVLRANRELLTRCQQTAFAHVVRDWLGERELTSCGPWWPATQASGQRSDRIDALALSGATARAAAAAHWATGVDGSTAAQDVREALASSPYRSADDLVVVARDGSGVVTPDDLYS